MSYTNGLDKPSDYFEATTYSGNNSNQSITSLDFAPNWVWLKGRAGSNSGQDHQLFDTVRGVEKRLASNTTGAESTDDVGLTAFNSNGWTMGSASQINGASTTYVGWSWKAGTSFTNDASATGIGTIDSTGSVSTDAGFSIVTFTGNSGSIAHGLAQKPAMVIIKPRNVSGSWIVTHKGLGAEMQDYYLFLDTTAAKATSNNIWGGEPTSTTFSVSSSLIDSANYVAYCFAEKQGYSKFGKYTSINSHDSTFVYLGFKPSMIIFKNTSYSGGSDWHILDRTRYTFNSSSEAVLEPNTSDAENYSAFGEVDFLSNGFKIRNNNGVSSGGYDHIFIAFAENPFVTSTGVPATAK